MARRRTSQPTTAEARDLALAIRQGERRGYTQREIGATLGIDPRTVRKIKSGQTSGTRTHRRIMRQPERASTRNVFNASFVIGYTGDGQPVMGSRNVIIGNLPTAQGGTRKPTPLDVFRVEGLAAVVAAERAKLARRYEAISTVATGDDIPRLRKIAYTRRRAVNLALGL